jgi:hypothetical protein
MRILLPVFAILCLLLAVYIFATSIRSDIQLILAGMLLLFAIAFFGIARAIDEGVRTRKAVDKLTTLSRDPDDSP